MVNKAYQLINAVEQESEQHIVKQIEILTKFNN